MEVFDLDGELGGILTEGRDLVLGGDELGFEVCELVVGRGELGFEDVELLGSGLVFLVGRVLGRGCVLDLGGEDLSFLAERGCF